MCSSLLYRGWFTLRADGRITGRLEADEVGAIEEGLGLFDWEYLGVCLGRAVGCDCSSLDLIEVCVDVDAAGAMRIRIGPSNKMT